MCAQPDGTQAWWHPPAAPIAAYLGLYKTPTSEERAGGWPARLGPVSRPAGMMRPLQGSVIAEGDTALGLCTN